MPALETPPLPQQLNLLDSIPPHQARDLEIRLRMDALLPTMDDFASWNAQAVHVPAGGEQLFPPMPYKLTTLFSVCRPVQEYISGTIRPLLLVQ
jgi:hypothetical protein